VRLAQCKQEIVKPTLLEDFNYKRRNHQRTQNPNVEVMVEAFASAGRSG
jgi:hypothetical protein